MTPALLAAFDRQAEVCVGLDSPFMGRVLPIAIRAVAPGSALAARLTEWPEARISAAHDSVPLRLAGALHHLHLRGIAPELSAAYPPNDVGDAKLQAAVAGALRDYELDVLVSLDSPPQTNEVRRAAVLIAMGHWLTARLQKPLMVSEIGASAGLNLNWDFFCMEAAGLTLGPERSPVRLSPEWRGLPPVVCPPYVAEARGVDLRPILVEKEEDALRLQSYLWPDQAERIARTAAAIALFKAPDTEGHLDGGDAIDWLPTRLIERPGHCHMIYSTIAWQYLPEDAQARGTAMIEEAGARATTDTPLAWLRMEPDGQSPGAGLLLRLWPGDLVIDLGRADYHGRWVNWDAPAP